MAFFTGNATEEIKKIKALPDGHLDFSTMPAFAKITKTREIKEFKKSLISGKFEMKSVGTEIVEERDLGAMVSMLTVAVQELSERMDKLEKKD